MEIMIGNGLIFASIAKEGLLSQKFMIPTDGLAGTFDLPRTFGGNAGSPGRSYVGTNTTSCSGCALRLIDYGYCDMVLNFQE